MDGMAAIVGESTMAKEEDLDELQMAYIEVFRDEGNAPSVLHPSKTADALRGKAVVGREAKPQVFRVQFNPSELSFSAGGSVTEKMKSAVTADTEHKVKQADVSMDAGKATVELALIFDRSIYEDASVQPEVEGFLSLIQNPYVRSIAFHWGKQCYEGILNSVSGEYTFFNSLGVPVRAKINMSIELAARCQR